MHYPGDYNVMVRGHRDIAYRQEVLDKDGVDMQVISLTTPGTHVETPAIAAKLAGITNDAFARVHAERPTRFMSPSPRCRSATRRRRSREFIRRIDQLKMPGAMLFSNINGTSGSSDERFWPLYEAANDRGAVLMIHPTFPLGVEAMTRVLADAADRLPLRHDARGRRSWSSAASSERYPRIRWVLGHLGGTIPYLAERLDRGYRAFKECRAHIDEPPTAYLQAAFLVRHGQLQPGAAQARDRLRRAPITSWPGSDYPHKIGSIPLMLEALRALPIPDADKAGILGGNAKRLLKA